MADEESDAGISERCIGDLPQCCVLKAAAGLNLISRRVKKLDDLGGGSSLLVPDIFDPAKAAAADPEFALIRTMYCLECAYYHVAENQLLGTIFPDAEKGYAGLKKYAEAGRIKSVKCNRY